MTDDRIELKQLNIFLAVVSEKIIRAGYISIGKFKLFNRE